MFRTVNSTGDVAEEKKEKYSVSRSFEQPKCVGIQLKSVNTELQHDPEIKVIIKMSQFPEFSEHAAAAARAHSFDLIKLVTNNK